MIVGDSGDLWNCTEWTEEEDLMGLCQGGYEKFGLGRSTPQHHLAAPLNIAQLRMLVL